MRSFYHFLICLIIITVPSSNLGLPNSEGDTILEMPSSTEDIDLSINQNYPLVAMVKPVFTAAAYAGYYTCFAGSTNYKTCFDQPILDGWAHSSGAVPFMDALIREGYPSENIKVINDITVHNGDIFDSLGRPIYSTLVFFHNEYVTLREYHNMVNFMKAGGNVIILNGNAFFAEVIYDSATNYVKLVSGHLWNFDGENGSLADVYKSRFRNGIYNKNIKIGSVVNIQHSARVAHPVPNSE